MKHFDNFPFVWNYEKYAIEQTSSLVFNPFLFLLITNEIIKKKNKWLFLNLSKPYSYFYLLSLVVFQLRLGQ